MGGNVNKKPAVFIPKDSDNFSHIIRGEKIGEGTYATVYHGWGVPKKEKFDIEKLKEMTKRKLETKDESILKLGNCFLLEKETKLPFRKYTRVAIKKNKVSSYGSGINISVIREINFLRELRHVNVTRVSYLYIWRFFLSQKKKF